MRAQDVDKMKSRDVRDYLKRLIGALDLADEADFFGTEGWRYYLMGEDE